MPQAARQPSAGVKTLVMMLIKALKGFIFSWGASPPPSAAGAVLVHGAARGDVAHGAHRVIDLGHMVADDHHVLPARLDDGDDAVGCP